MTPWYKLFSGRLWLTIIAGGVFAYCACFKILTPEAIAAILTAVFTSYFNRADRQASQVTAKISAIKSADLP
jgi:hypothetical protein